MVVSNIFYFSPLLGEDFQFDSYFSDGLVQPPTRLGERMFRDDPKVASCLKFRQLLEPTWQEHNPAKLKSRVLIGTTLCCQELKGVARQGCSLWQTWGEEGLNGKRDEEH